MMKHPIKFIALLSGAALLSAGSAFAGEAPPSVSTDPVGYVTETLKPAQFNLFGLNLSSAVVASGALDGVSGTTLTDNDSDFTTSMPGDSDYYIKITSGTAELGVNTDVTATTATTITTADDISSLIAAGATYTIRKVLTVADVFGEANETELLGATAGDTTDADIIWIPNGAGGYDKVYYNSTPRAFPALTVGWKNTVTGADASDAPLYFYSSILVEVKRAAFGATEAGVDPLDLTSKGIVIAGAVDTIQTQVALENGFNAISRVFPGGFTFGESGLEDDLAQATAGDTTNADLVWVPNDSGGYDKYYYNGTARVFPALSVGWKNTVTGADATGVSLESGVFIERKGAATMTTMVIPASADL